MSIESYRKLVNNFGGGYIYIQKKETICRELRNKKIKEEFNGDYKSLSRKYHLSEKMIRNIIEEI